MLWMVLRKKWHRQEGNQTAAFLFKIHEPTYQLNICSFVRFLITHFLYCKVSYSAWKGLNSDSSPPAILLFPCSSAPRNRHCCMRVALRLDAIKGRLSVLSQKFGWTIWKCETKLFWSQAPHVCNDNTKLHSPMPYATFGCASLCLLLLT